MKTRQNFSLFKPLFKLALAALCLTPFLIGFFINLASAGEYVIKRDAKTIGRAPASIMATDDLYMSPLEQEIWLNNVMVEDDRGILNDIAQKIRTWEETDLYAQQWNLTSTGLFQTPTDEQRKNYFGKQFIKYLDRRISGEVKNAEEGSTFHTIGQVQQNLSPETSVEMAPNIRLRFRARVLEGAARMMVENPYIENTTTIDYKGQLHVNLNRQFKKIDLRTHFDVNVNEGNWQAAVDRPLTETVTGRIAARHTEEYDEEAIVQLSYSLRF